MDTPQPKSLKVLLIGDACTDRYYYGSVNRLSPEAPVPVLKHLYTEERLGMCLNVGANLEALGAFVDILKNDEMIYKDRFVDAKTKQHLLRADFGESEKVRAIDLSKISVVGYDAVVVSDYGKGFISRAAASDISVQCHEANIPLFVDSKKKNLECYKHCFIKINEKENADLQQMNSTAKLIVTLGSRGAQYQGVLYPTEECEVFDVSGAGDTFMSALVYKFLESKDMPTALKFANDCARIVVQKFGTYCLQPKDLK
jgi:D-beta-D-heptose 7-phosphate kinase/D-beta-D-heptose 1-phosphate adenosyltransferase